ncbi:hypothetical protein [Vibrio paucivorans]
MSQELKYAKVTIEIAFDEQADEFCVKGTVNGDGASKLSNLAASAVSGAVIPTVNDVTSKIAHLYGEVGEDIYHYIEKEMDAIEDDKEAK